MSRRTLNMSIIVLGIILLNGLAFVGAGGADPVLGSALPGNTANHPSLNVTEEQADLATQALPSQANHHQRTTAATQQEADAAAQDAAMAVAKAATTQN